MEIRPGDWTFPSCEQNVYANRNECFKCRTPKPATKSTSPESAIANMPTEKRVGDWICPNCKQNVFASKISCFRCHTPKTSISGCNSLNFTAQNECPGPVSLQALRGSSEPFLSTDANKMQSRSWLEILRAAYHKCKADYRHIAQVR